MMFLFWTSDRRMQVSSIGGKRGGGIVAAKIADWGDDRRTEPWRLPLAGGLTSMHEQGTTLILDNFGIFTFLISAHAGRDAVSLVTFSSPILAAGKLIGFGSIAMYLPEIILEIKWYSSYRGNLVFLF